MFRKYKGQHHPRSQRSHSQRFRGQNLRSQHSRSARGKVPEANDKAILESGSDPNLSGALVTVKVRELGSGFVSGFGLVLGLGSGSVSV